jgi:hypothetical protein
MQICNTGAGAVTFHEGPGGDFIEWLKKQEFTVSEPEMEKLRSASLLPGGCIDIAVRFSSTEEGTYRDSAQLFANVRDKKDYSIWTAIVRKIAGVTETGARSATVSLHPNPVSGSTSFGFHLESPGVARLVVVDIDGREVGMVERRLPAGDQSLVWDATSLPAGVYFYRLAAGGSVSSGSVVVVR